MRILPIHVIPIFLERVVPGVQGAQIRYFDVYYRVPPAVGFHVVGCPAEDSGVMGFSVSSETPEVPPVVGFNVTHSISESGVIGFIVGDES